MQFNTGIFRAYDIRGVYPCDINEEVAYEIARAFSWFLNQKRKENQRLDIVVGRDNRLSSLSIHQRFIEGIISTGANVIDIGFSTTPMLYFGVAHYEFDGGVEISASHNAPEYNGFKLVREKSRPISGATGLEEIKKAVLEDRGAGGQEKGELTKKDVLKDYVQFVLGDVNFGRIKPLRIAIDTANGIVGMVIPEIFKDLPFEVHHIFSELDGTFPNHPPNPLVEENLVAIKKEIKEKKADLGVAFDGDGDRIIFLDEQGEVVPADLVGALVAENILEENPGQKILYDLRSSNVIKEKILEKGGVPLMGRVGHSFIKERMRKENIIFAQELSGHYYFKGRYFCESPFFVLFRILKKISDSGKKFSEIAREYRKYFHSGEINFEVDDKEKKIKELQNYFKEGKITKLDGIRIDFSDWWFNVRPSNTEPLLRLVIEAETKEMMERKKEEISSLIQEK